MHNVLWTCKQTKHCRYIKTQARKGPSATANFFLLSSHVQPCSRLWTHSCTSFSSQLCVLLLSASPASLYMHSTMQAPLSSPEQTSDPQPSTTGKSQSILSSSGPWKPRNTSRNTPRWSCRHADFFGNAQKTNSYFLEGNVISNINILTLKALPHLPVSFWFSFCWRVGWVSVGQVTW